jgi:hypothetical protein
VVVAAVERRVLWNPAMRRLGIVIASAAAAATTAALLGVLAGRALTWLA